MARRSSQSGRRRTALEYADGMKRQCPICEKPTEVNGDFPFCSERCRWLDLGDWAAERYVISEPAFDESMFENLERDLAGADEETDQ
jgi:endogenous inhibitor of DNA gyrase (YacG/DUF329 family)